MLVVGIVLLYCILVVQFESIKQPLIVLVLIPSGILGSVLCLRLFNAPLDPIALIGMIIVTGILINDSILKVDTINRLRAKSKSTEEKGEKPSLVQLIKTGSEIRLRPIIMTSATTILALMPVFLFNHQGSEIQKSLSYSIIGGLIASTLCSIYIVPLLYDQFSRS